METKQRVAISKYLARHLRHAPERLGLILAPGGWVEVEDLLTACENDGHPITPAQLRQVVAENDKQRFSFDESGTRIRANQGHSTAVDLELRPQVPPGLLYHGTGHQSVAVIEREGLRKMRRHHVHLSSDVETAIKVGARHGRPTVFEVDSAGMHADGYRFYRSDNGVWLTDQVPPRYLARLEE